jgi:hypothetical protein
MSERASVFGSEGDFDVSGFAPRKPKVDAPRERVRQVSEASDFRSREPEKQPAAAREPRRYRTGRNIHLNIKVRPDTHASFYQIADEQGWVLGETLERAVDALKRELAR